jgi:N,N'-diacetyllegionaminate synthase
VNDVLIIADIGSNHRGKLDLAIRAVQAAKDWGADVVKYQLYTHEELYGLPMPQPSQGDKVTGFQREWLEPVAKECERVGIEFMITAFSPKVSLPGQTPT